MFDSFICHTISLSLKTNAMTKYPFTPTGASDLQAALYALSDADLLLQADAVRLDFKQFMKDNFTLSTAQESYLDALDSRLVSYLSENISFCFIYRLPIYLTQDTPVPDASKWIKTKNSIETSTSDSVAFEVGGSFAVNIVYES
jgi:hypothetical protein